MITCRHPNQQIDDRYQNLLGNPSLLARLLTERAINAATVTAFAWRTITSASPKTSPNTGRENTVLDLAPNRADGYDLTDRLRHSATADGNHWSPLAGQSSMAGVPLPHQSSNTAWNRAVPSGGSRVIVE